MFPLNEGLPEKREKELPEMKKMYAVSIVGELHNRDTQTRGVRTSWPFEDDG